MKKTLIVATLSFFLGILIAGLIFIYFPEKNYSENFPESSSSTSLSPSLFAQSTGQTRQNLDFVTIAEQTAPAVVQIVAEKIEKRRTMGFFEDPFEDFWERFFESPRPRQRPREREFRSTSGGTGFFISPDGYIITNNHIVESAVDIKVVSLQVPVTTSHAGVSKEDRKRLGISDSLIRVSVGIEKTEDIIEDFEQALNV